MATKTMILRPYLVDSPDETLVSFVPSTTNISSAHTLINETTADDDSGYIICSAGGEINSYFNYKHPSNMITITGISVKVRCKLESSQNIKTLENKLTVSSTFSATDMTAATGYVDSELVFSENDTIINELNSINEKNILLISRVPSGTKQSPIRITQIYIEIIYEATSDIYQKTNGTWIKLQSPKFYKFSNSRWGIMNDNEFYDGQKYILNST